VFVLGNHGLVVCGESCEAAESLLSEVQRRLAIGTRSASKPNIKLLERIRGASSWRLPDSDTLHALGTDFISRQILEGGILYPCQTIFLGQNRVTLRVPEDKVSSRKAIDPLDASRPFLIVEECGILINSEITAVELAVLRGLAEVVLRIEPGAPIRYLSDPEVTSLLAADSHLYRVSAENGWNSIHAYKHRGETGHHKEDIERQRPSP
jgi:hypothetical protein